MSITLNHKTKTARLTDMAGNILFIAYREALRMVRLGLAKLEKSNA